MRKSHGRKTDRTVDRKLAWPVTGGGQCGPLVVDNVSSTATDAMHHRWCRDGDSRCC